MEPGEAPERRWTHSGLFAALLIVLGIAAVLLFITSGSGGIDGDLTIDPAALAAVPLSDVDVRSFDDPWFGNPEADVVIVEFADFQCPFCRRSFPDVRELMTRYANEVLFIFRDYPIAELHPDAGLAAEAGQCAWEQGSDAFWAFHDRLFLNQDDLSVPALKAHAAGVGLDRTAFSACLDAGDYRGEVAADYADGLAAGVQGTPTFFINNRRFPGAVPKDILEEVILAQLRATR